MELHDHTFIAAESATGRLLELLTFQAGYNATIVLLGTALLGIGCGIIGSFLLLRGRSMVADALSHAALPGVCMGFLLSVMWGGDGKSLPLLLAGAAVCGLLGVACVQLIATLPRIKEDAAIGIVLSVFFAGGIVLLKVIERLPTGNQAGLNRFIFGSAASMVGQDLIVLAILAGTALLVPVVFFKELRLTCFDRAFARSLGWSTLALDAVLLALVTLATVAGLNAVGAILIVALLIIPAAAARFWTNRLLLMMVLAAGIGGLGSSLGTAVSVTIDDMPTGPAIVVACGALFLVGLIGAPQRGLLPRAMSRLLSSGRMERAHLLRAVYEAADMAGDGDATIPIEMQAILRRRRWNQGHVTRLVKAAVRRGELNVTEPDKEDSVPRYGLSPSGHTIAARIVRTHRLWEYYLTIHADIAPNHVDRAADTIEHVIGHDLVTELEAALQHEGLLSAAGEVPESAHVLINTNGGANTSGGGDA